MTNEKYSLSFSSCIFIQTDHVNAVFLLANFVNESNDLPLCIIFHSHKLIDRYAHTNDHNCTLLIAILFLIIVVMQAIRRGCRVYNKVIKKVHLILIVDTLLTWEPWCQTPHDYEPGTIITRVWIM